MNKLILTLIASLFFSFTIFSQQINSEITSKIDSVFSQWDQQESPGLAVAVVKEGKVVLQKAYGQANLEYNIPISTNTVFHAASLAKQFTAYAVLLLEEEGLLSLDDDVRKFIPEVPDFGKTITLRHMATHTSGLKDQWRMLEMAGWRLDDVITTNHIIQLVEKQKTLNFDPGTQVSYSNTGFTLLAEVVARVSGKPFAQFTAERIFNKLGMENSLFYDDYQKVVKNRAYAYQKRTNIYEKTRLNFSTVGATSLFTTVEDMCIWAQHLNKPPIDKKNVIENMNTLGKLNDGTATEAALGQWGATKYHGLEWFDHTGSDGGYRAYFSRFPEINSAIILLANVPDVNTRSLSYKTVNLFIKEHFVDNSSNRNDDKLEVKTLQHSFTKLNKSQLSKYTGKYFEVNEWYDREIVLKNDTLHYVRTNGSESKLAPISKNEFIMLGEQIDVRVFFTKNEKKEMRMNVKIEGRDLEAIFTKYTELKGDEFRGNYYSQELGSTYSLKSVNKNGLNFFNHRLGEIPLIPVNENLLTSKNRNFKKVEVIRDKKGGISELVISNYGMRKISFNRL